MRRKIQSGASAGNVSSLDVDFYTISQNMLSDRFIDQAHRLDREVWVWTVNIERNMREVLKYDVDGIITDFPERLQMLVGVE
jgi:glycerophosphoryl diester phosphodiesterase